MRGWAGIILVLGLSATYAHGEGPYTVCTATINSSEEKETFRASLPPGKFKFVELTDFSEAKVKELRGDDWFNKACEAGVKCDVLLISGHFGGNFFGKTGFSLEMKTLEKASCSNSCAGILSQPKEVFLFGCNTLAAKEQDNRTPEEYLHVLLRDEIPRGEAERIVEARYGAAGDSFRDRMRRVFSGIPNLYGFDSIGPAGNTIKPFLKKYFAEVPNYFSHLQKIETNGLVNLVGKANEQLAEIRLNLPLKSALKDTSFVECAGLMPTDAAYGLRQDICGLYDDKINAAGKVAMISRMMRGPDRMLYLPSVAGYLRNSHSILTSDGDARKVLEELGKDDSFRESIDEISKSLKHSLALQTDLLRFRQVVGWISEDDFRSGVRKSLDPYLKKLDRESVDLICSLAEENNLEFKVGLEDVNASAVSTPDGASVFSCLKTTDERIAAEAVKAIPAAKGDRRASLLQAFDELPGEDEQVLRFARSSIAAKGLEERVLAKSLVLKRSADLQEKIALLLASEKEPDDLLFYLIGTGGVRDDRIAKMALDKLVRKKDLSLNLLLAVANGIPRDSTLWPELFRALEKKGNNSIEVFTNVLPFAEVGSPLLTEWAVEKLLEPGAKTNFGLIYALRHSELTDAQLRRLADRQMQNPEDVTSLYIMGILLLNKERLTKNVLAQGETLKGASAYYDCVKKSVVELECK